MGKKMTQEEFLQKYVDKYGDQDDYSKVEYKYIPKVKFGGWTECFSENIYDLRHHILGCEHEYKIENDLRETGLTLEEYHNP